MGSVYLSEDENLGRRAAIKMISDKVENINEASARFLREAKAMAMVDPILYEFMHTENLGVRRI